MRRVLSHQLRRLCVVMFKVGAAAAAALCVVAFSLVRFGYVCSGELTIATVTAPQFPGLFVSSLDGHTREFGVSFEGSGMIARWGQSHVHWVAPETRLYFSICPEANWPFPQRPSGFLGFSVEVRSDPGSGPTRFRHTRMTIPWWAAFVVVAPAPSIMLVRFTRRHRKRRRAEHGLCVECGYDLRATPLHCPECGAGRPLTPGVSPSTGRGS
jgi:hypothetical protein